LEPAGPSRLGHVRPPAAALAAEDLGALAYQIDRGEARGEVVGDADDDTGLALLGDADDGDHPRAQALLALVGEAAQVLQINALDCARQKLHVADHAHAIGALRPSAAAHGKLLLSLRKLAFEAAPLVEHLRQALRHLFERRLELRGRRLREFAQVPRVLARRRAGERLDPAHAGGDRAVAKRGDDTNIARAFDVGAAAELHRPAH